MRDVETGPKHLGRDVGVLPQQQRLNALHGGSAKGRSVFLDQCAAMLDLHKPTASPPPATLHEDVLKF